MAHFKNAFRVGSIVLIPFVGSMPAVSFLATVCDQRLRLTSARLFFSTGRFPTASLCSKLRCSKLVGSSLSWASLRLLSFLRLPGPSRLPQR